MNEPFGIVPHGTSRFELQGRGQRVAVVDTLPDATLFAAAPALHAALRNLVGADNCNYDRHAMRYEGYFDQARAALETATGERLPHLDGPQTGKSIFVIVEEREAERAAWRALASDLDAWFASHAEGCHLHERLRAVLATSTEH